MSKLQTFPLSLDELTAASTKAASPTTFWAKIVGASSSRGKTNFLVRKSGESSNEWMYLASNLKLGAKIGMTALTKGYQVYIHTDSSGYEISQIAIYS